ncbi:MAG: DUF4178 domain-containing protein [Elusimicrobia bacterium]|nr:DUF4178 domain-containing protein [Elusimicrobiota bacterium]
MADLNCPSCGAKLAFRSSISLIVVCAYCRSQVLRDDLSLKDLGKVAQLHRDGSVLQLGARGAYRGTPFSAIGRLQMSFPDGYWNEWCLSLADGRQAWLGEAAGTYAFSVMADRSLPLPPYEKLSLGQDVTIGDRAYEVTDLRHASYLSAEGELPFRAPLGEAAPLADLRGSGASFATLDYSEAPPLAFLGEYVPFAELKLDGLKAPEGW